MRIIKASKQLEEAKITCDTCGSILGIKYGDIMNTGYATHYIVCPVCNKEVYTSSAEDLFPWIMEEENETSDRDIVRQY
jgi:uncharacterized Zn finger protein (UPF0148 family)